MSRLPFTRQMSRLRLEGVRGSGRARLGATALDWGQLLGTSEGCVSSFLPNGQGEEYPLKELGLKEQFFLSLGAHEVP